MTCCCVFFFFFFFNATATTEIYTLSLHDALPICEVRSHLLEHPSVAKAEIIARQIHTDILELVAYVEPLSEVKDRKSTRLNSSHTVISYAVFCLKKKKTYKNICLNKIYHK